MIKDSQLDERERNLRDRILEERRLRTLTNVQLVMEHLKFEEEDDEAYVNEMYSRLFPDWHKGEEDLKS